MGLFWVPVGLFQVVSTDYLVPTPLPHLFHAHPRGESYFDFSAEGHTSTSVQYAGPLSWSLPPKHHEKHFCSAFPFLRAVLEGSMFWVGSSCAFDIPQGPDLMTSVPYDQRNCWFFCLPATASGASADSLACTSIRKDCQDKAAAYPNSPLEDPPPLPPCPGGAGAGGGAGFRSESSCSAALWTLWRHGFWNNFPRCSSSSQYKYWDAVNSIPHLDSCGGFEGHLCSLQPSMLFTTLVSTWWIFSFSLSSFYSVPFLFLYRAVSHLLYLSKTKNCSPAYYKGQTAQNDWFNRPA